MRVSSKFSPSPQNNYTKFVYFSLKIGFQFLDFIDRDIFGMSHDGWYKLKNTVDSTNGLLVISGEILKLFTGKVFNYVV